jgi:AcrR family transcriptional regulator
MAKVNRKPAASHSRRRLTREERYRQLLDVAWSVVREEGTDALTLGRLSQRAEVAKPVVYDHFGTRSGLLAAMYSEFDARQHALMDAALEKGRATLEDRAKVIASSYVDCVLAQGHEIPEVIAALAGSPELERVKREGEKALLDKCYAVLAPFAPARAIGRAGLRAMLGAAEALSWAAANGEITRRQAEAELVAAIVAMVSRQIGRRAS